MVFFDVAPTTAIGCAMVFTVGTGLLGVIRHGGKSNVDWNAIFSLGAGACTGTFVGYFLHKQLAVLASDSLREWVTGIICCLALVDRSIGLAKPENKGHCWTGTG